MQTQENPPPVAGDLEQTINAARKNLGLTDDEIARLLAVDPTTLERFLNHPGDITPEFQERRVELWNATVLIERVSESPQAGLAWLNESELQVFQGRRPIDLLREGNIDPVLTALAGMDSGLFS